MFTRFISIVLLHFLIEVFSCILRLFGVSASGWSHALLDNFIVDVLLYCRIYMAKGFNTLFENLSPLFVYDAIENPVSPVLLLIFAQPFFDKFCLVLNFFNFSRLFLGRFTLERLGTLLFIFLRHHCVRHII